MRKINIIKILKVLSWLVLIGLASCNDNSSDPVAALKQRIEKAEMVEYTDSFSSWNDYDRCKGDWHIKSGLSRQKK